MNGIYIVVVAALASTMKPPHLRFAADCSNSRLKKKKNTFLVLQFVVLYHPDPQTFKVR